MDDLTKFIKPLSKQTSWADAVDDDSSDEDFDVGDSRDGFEENQNSNDYADVGLQQKSSKVVQGVSFASLLRSTSTEENAPVVAETEPSTDASEAQPSEIATEPLPTSKPVVLVPKAPAVNPWNKVNKMPTKEIETKKVEAKKVESSKESTQVEVPAVKATPPPSIATSDAKVKPGVSFLNKVLGGQTQKKPEFEFDLNSAPTKPLEQTKLKVKTPMNLSLDSSRDGLNLLFSQVVKTNAGGLSTPKSVLSTISEKPGTPKGGVPYVPQPLTQQRIEKRQRQIDIGKSSTGYQNYIQKVPKDSRVEGEVRHPTTPNKNEQISKRRFDAKMSDWRRVLHLWDDPNVNPMEVPMESIVSIVSPRTEQKKSKAKGAATNEKMQVAAHHGIKRKATKTPQGAINKKKISKIELGSVSAFPSLKSM